MQQGDIVVLTKSVKTLKRTTLKPGQRGIVVAEPPNWTRLFIPGVWIQVDDGLPEPTTVFVFLSELQLDQ